uniref:Uncharacterized protein n=1 Tax=Tanacetum cinerariifolium TaxID=118510 RepID=A0A699HCN6_TANCI|nr:hypothetical protein [Tanacetum cinerariifolium]
MVEDVGDVNKKKLVLPRPTREGGYMNVQVAMGYVNVGARSNSVLNVRVMASGVDICGRKIYIRTSSSCTVYDDDDILCIQELKAESSSVKPTNTVLAVESSLPREGTLENLLIQACNYQNNTVTFHCMVMIENFKNKKGGTTHPAVMQSAEKVPPDNLGNGSVKHVTGLLTIQFSVADDTTSTVVVMFNDTATKLILCSAKSLMVGDDEGADAYSDSNLPTTIRNLVGTTHVLEIKSHTYYEYGSFESFTCWKINSSDPVDDAASSSTPTLIADEASLSFKRLAKHLTVKTPSKPNEEKKKKGVSKCFITIQDTDRHSYLHYLTTFISFHYFMLELEDSDGDKACPT